MTEKEFKDRFVARMMTEATEDEEARSSLENYAQQVAQAAWDEPEQREEGPEACAEADISYWGEE